MTRPRGGCWNFRPVLRNRAAMGWIIVYRPHLELVGALRPGRDFLTAVCVSQGGAVILPDRPMLFTVKKKNSGARRYRRLDHRNERPTMGPGDAVVTLAMRTAAPCRCSPDGASAPSVVAPAVVLWHARAILTSLDRRATVQASRQGIARPPHCLTACAAMPGIFSGPSRRAGASITWKARRLGCCLRPSLLDHATGLFLLGLRLGAKCARANFGCYVV